MDFDFDVLVAGAGPAGSLAARDLARAGFRVALFDRSSRETLGKSVVVEVEKDIFRRVGLAPPGETEIPYHPGLAGPLLKAAPVVQGLYRHHRNYPKTFEPADFQRWREERLRIFSRLPR